MIKKAIVAIGFLASMQSISMAATQTTTTFKTPSEVQQDEYGNDYIDREAVISTQNFKVDNFWNNFKENGDSASNYTTISRSGLFRITTSATSACTMDNTLDEEGCSGQKPFLINNEVLDNPVDGTSDTYRVAFTNPSDYTNNDYNGFYPLDVLRDAKYYKDNNVNTDGGSTTPRSGFFGFITGAVDSLYNRVIGVDFFGQKDIADVEYAPRSDAAEDRRQRYIANIMAGVEKEHRMTKNANGASATAINAPTLNSPVSLLNYAEAKKSTTEQECKFLGLQLSTKGAMCRVMSGFGMDAWMPFFNLTGTTKVESNFLLADTENALLAMNAKLDGVPYLQDVGSDETTKLTFLQNIIKPMTTMVGFMKGMLFGEKKKDIVADPVQRVYSFNEDEAMTMTFPVTNDGTQIDDFAHFKLLKIRSVYADEINSCTVKKKPGMLKPSSWEETFYIGGNVEQKSPNYTLWNKEIWNSDEWVDWCQEATGKKGMFTYLLNWNTGGFFNPFNWMRGFFQAFLNFLTGTYEITNFTNTVKRGLILDLKKVNLDPISKRNTREIQILHIKTPSAGQ